jgi:hypothetical protein
MSRISSKIYFQKLVKKKNSASYVIKKKHILKVNWLLKAFYLFWELGDTYQNIYNLKYFGENRESFGEKEL